MTTKTPFLWGLSVPTLFGQDPLFSSDVPLTQDQFRNDPENLGLFLTREEAMMDIMDTLVSCQEAVAQGDMTDVGEGFHLMAVQDINGELHIRWTDSQETEDSLRTRPADKILPFNVEA